MLTHPVQVITHDITHPWDIMRGHSNWEVFVPLRYDDNADELRRHASDHIKGYHDEYATEQHGHMTPKGFKYTMFTYTRSGE